MSKSSEQFIRMREEQAMQERSRQQEERINRLLYMELDKTQSLTIEMQTDHYLSVNEQLS